MYTRPPGDPFGALFAELMIFEFSIIPEKRGPNFYDPDNGSLKFEFDEHIREATNDSLELIVPITWSLDSFLGFPQPRDVDLERWIETAHVIIESEALHEAQRVSSAEDPCIRAPYAFVDGVMRCSALNESDYQRHGFLAICQSGIALIGTKLNWSPLPISSLHTSTTNGPALHPSTSSQHRHLYTQLPIGNPDYSYQVLEYIPYNELENLISTELVRFDGLATLLYTTQSDYALRDANYRKFVEDYIGKPLPPELFPGAMLPLYFPRNPLGDVDCTELLFAATDSSEHYYDFFKNCFIHELSERVCAGWMPVVGTGMTPDRDFKMSAFNSALGIQFVSKYTKRTLHIESIFSELDFVFETITSRVSNASSSVRIEKIAKEEKTANSQDFVDQLKQLSILRESGALTEAEFSAAKARLLGN